MTELLTEPDGPILYGHLMTGLLTEPAAPSGMAAHQPDQRPAPGGTT